MDTVKKERDEYLAGWQRAKADLLNYKKETVEKTRVLKEMIKIEQVLECLPILDDLEMATSQLTAKQKKDSVIKGFLQISERFKKMLKAQGIEEVKTVGKKFDPALHEAIGEVKGEKSGVIIEEMQKGYIRDGVLIRAAKVKVGK
ncbi:MAG: nucleotide exchange factor GrpE [Patescibacteria group bacterium]|nr:nucleotide exchange factor GrpE [Patescibacteria group bacterium]